jgi:hypothetical protein
MSTKFETFTSIDIFCPASVLPLPKLTVTWAKELLVKLPTKKSKLNINIFLIM